MMIQTVGTVMDKVQLRELLADAKLSKSAKVKELFSQGYTVKQIADLVGIRYNFAYNVIRNHIVINDVEVNREQTTSKKDQVFAMYDIGKTLTEVSKELKMNYNYAWKLHEEWKRMIEKEAKAAEAAEGPIGEMITVLTELQMAELSITQ